MFEPLLKVSVADSGSQIIKGTLSTVLMIVSFVKKHTLKYSITRKERTKVLGTVTFSISKFKYDVMTDL